MAFLGVFLEGQLHINIHTPVLECLQECLYKILPSHDMGASSFTFPC